MNNQSWAATLVVVLISFGGGYVAGRQTSHPGDSTATVPAAGTLSAVCRFSPQGGCTDAIVSEIDRATRTVELQGYSFTSRPIGDALVGAHRRGVKVTVILDALAASENRKEPNYVARSGVPVFLDAKHAVAHNKVVLVDGRTLITGSFNFTRAAEEHNAENLLIVHDQPALQGAYERNFRDHLAHSEQYAAQ